MEMAETKGVEKTAKSSLSGLFRIANFTAVIRIQAVKIVGGIRLNNFSPFRISHLSDSGTMQKLVVDVTTILLHKDKHHIGLPDRLI